MGRCGISERRQRNWGWGGEGGRGGDVGHGGRRGGGEPPVGVYRSELSLDLKQSSDSAVITSVFSCGDPVWLTGR